ncbi:MAG: hypothetical protein EZS28_015692 [Streblomastix strix]|uniref:HECT-type E3 ubiquitin transferase n=1 Tax=Streblomastix strix TaxID=222440 RepID=A0A5J4W1L2_9EUKA|nr:MAG: hypothetical protein EZS28_015692 [Streblomastix strix]
MDHFDPSRDRKSELCTFQRRFLNRVLIKVLFENFQVETHFQYLKYKTHLDLPFFLSDLEPIDADAYQQLVFITMNDPSGLVINFTLTNIEFDQMKEIELNYIEKDIELTLGNQKEYIKLLIKQKLTVNIGRHLCETQKGFHELLLYGCLKAFTPDKLEIMLYEVDQIDFEDWKSKTDLNQ